MLLSFDILEITCHLFVFSNVTVFYLIFDYVILFTSK